MNALGAGVGGGMSLKFFCSFKSISEDSPKEP